MWLPELSFLGDIELKFESHIVILILNILADPVLQVKLLVEN